MQAPVRIGSTKVKAGTRLTIDLPTARLYTHTEMVMPVHVIHGRQNGPRIFISPAIHGDEINGIEVVRRLLRLKLMNSIRGTLIAIPIVNIFGFINRTRYLPDRRDLNRSFPGRETGSLASRLARLFIDEIASKCTHGIDIHTGTNHRFNLPQIRTEIDNKDAKEMALAFNAPVIIDSKLRDGSLRHAASEMGIPLIIYEAGEALRFNEISIRAGVKGIVSVMRQVGLLPEKPEKVRRVEPLMARSTSWVRAPISGMLQKTVPIGAKVEKDDVLGCIVDPYGETEENIVSTSSAVIVGKLNLPLVYKGDALFHLASIKGPAQVENAIDLLDFNRSEDYTPFI